MSKFKNRTIVRAIVFVFVAWGTGVSVVPSPLLAQEDVWPSNAEAHPGEIVYSRDVPYGTATRRFSQGEARTVSPDQSRLIQHSLLVGLEPLSDAEQAAVSAPLARSIATMESALDLGLAALAKVSGNSDFTRSESAGSSAGGLVSQGLSVLPSALSAIGAVTGGDK